MKLYAKEVTVMKESLLRILKTNLLLKQYWHVHNYTPRTLKLEFEVLEQ